jgi:hypothetical protein
MPLEIESVAADPVKAGERGVELFAEILREARAVALDEAILGAVPLAEHIDGIVELCRPNGRQEARHEKSVDQLPAGDGDRRFSAAERSVDFTCCYGSCCVGVAAAIEEPLYPCGRCPFPLPSLPKKA